MIRVQREDFDAQAEARALVAGNHRVGGVVTFVGLVRANAGETAIDAMTLEHYPGMAERELGVLVEEAKQRWRLDNVCVIHRTGELLPSDPIVFVAAASAHRADALEACTFLIDWLKTKAPFWKKETTTQGPHWVDAARADDIRAARWEKPAN